MTDDNEETALRATAHLHHVVEELRALLTAAAAAHLHATRVSRGPGPADLTSPGTRGSDPAWQTGDG
jgi:hypothetical protein